MRPRIATKITHHTIWQALTGQLPPLALPALPIAFAALDNRDIGKGDLFVALAGQRTDGHQFIASAIQNGASAIFCEERGQAMATESGAWIVDCRAGHGPLKTDWEQMPATIAYLVDNCTNALQRVGGFQRVHHSQPALRVIGITGSIGKTSTKELASAVMRRKYETLHNPGNLNSEEGLPLTLLALDENYQCAVLEMAMYALGEIRRLCELARPHVGIVTNIGPVHLERLGTIENIAKAKSELVQALPSVADGGVAILNWDDELIRPMAEMTQAKIFRYGETPEADLWADEITSAGMDGIRFRFHYRQPESQKVESVHVRVPLLGRHSVHTALRAAALGLVEGMGWDEIIAGMQSLPSQLRLVVVPGVNGATVIDDTYNASPASTIAALNLLADIEPTEPGERIAVLGDMRELGSASAEGHQLVGRRAAVVVDRLVTVGDLGQLIGEAARDAGLPDAQIHSFKAFEETIEFLHATLKANDLVLVKGSRAVGMETIATQISVTKGTVH